MTAEVTELLQFGRSGVRGAPVVWLADLHHSTERLQQDCNQGGSERMGNCRWVTCETWGRHGFRLSLVV